MPPHAPVRPDVRGAPARGVHGVWRSRRVAFTAYGVCGAWRVRRVSRGGAVEPEVRGPAQKVVQVKATWSPAASLNWQPPTGVGVPFTDMFQYAVAVPLTFLMVWTK